MIDRYSRELVRQSVVGIDAVLKNRLVKVVSDALDTALLTGDGTNHSITGLINQAGVQQADGDIENPDSFLNAIAKASAAEVKPNRWFFKRRRLHQPSQAEGEPVVGALPARERRDRRADLSLFGIPVTVTNKLPSGVTVLADTSQIAVARDLAPSVTVLTERYAEFDEIGIRVVTLRPGPCIPEAVVLMDGRNS